MANDELSKILTPDKRRKLSTFIGETWFPGETQKLLVISGGTPQQRGKILQAAKELGNLVTMSIWADRNEFDAPTPVHTEGEIFFVYGMDEGQKVQSELIGINQSVGFPIIEIKIEPMHNWEPGWYWLVADNPTIVLVTDFDGDMAMYTRLAKDATTVSMLQGHAPVQQMIKIDFPTLEHIPEGTHSLAREYAAAYYDRIS